MASSVSSQNVDSYVSDHNSNTMNFFFNDSVILLWRILLSAQFKTKMKIKAIRILKVFGLESSVQFPFHLKRENVHIGK